MTYYCSVPSRLALDSKFIVDILILPIIPLKGCPDTEALIGHDAAIAAGKEARFHVILLDAAAAEASRTACAGGPLGESGNRRAILR